MTNKTFSDIRAGDWIDMRLPKAVRPYARLMRLDRPIGTWLLLLPCLWGLALASNGWPNLWHVFLFSLGSLIMRGAGCIINDICDRDLDRSVERTQTRPLASGQVTVLQSILFLLFLFLLGLLVLLQFNSFTILLGVASVPVVCLYPLAKRFIWCPQLILGLAFNWGALMGWSATRGELAVPAFLLYVGGIFWTLGYDTIYAHQDKEDDRIVGIKSLALFLGDRSKSFITFFYAAFIFFIFLAAYHAKIGFVFFYGLMAALCQAQWQLSTWNMGDPANCLARFRSNRDLGLIVLAAILCGRALL